MSFSSNVKEELVRQLPNSRHCRLAELLAFLEVGCKVTGYHSGQCRIELLIENEVVRRKFFTLLRKTFNIGIVFLALGGSDAKPVAIVDGEEAERVLDAVHWDAQDSIHDEILKRECCRRTYLRGAFLAAGSITNPDKFYHFEIVAEREALAVKLQRILQTFEVEGKLVERKNHTVLYIKEGSQIVSVLGLMGAGLSLMELENVRILKEMRSDVNRKVNCETANLNKVVNAAVRQLEDIRIIQEKLGLENLPVPLREIAEARLSDTDASLIEIGKKMSPPIGKSGVNHRFRKLSQIAENLEKSKEDQGEI